VANSHSPYSFSAAMQNGLSPSRTLDRPEPSRVKNPKQRNATVKSRTLELISAGSSGILKERTIDNMKFIFKFLGCGDAHSLEEFKACASLPKHHPRNVKPPLPLVQ
jgi:hypothetical protein